MTEEWHNDIITAQNIPLSPSRHQADVSMFVKLWQPPNKISVKLNVAEAKLGIFSTYYITCVQYRQEFNFPLIHVLFEIISTLWSTLNYQTHGRGEIGWLF